MPFHYRCIYLETDENGLRWYECPVCHDQFTEENPTGWGDMCDGKPLEVSHG